MHGGRMIEHLAVVMYSMRKDLLLHDNPTLRTDDAWEMARNEVAPLFDVSSATLDDWRRRTYRRERMERQRRL
jgi:hypothetical protein